MVECKSFPITGDMSPIRTGSGEQIISVSNSSYVLLSRVLGNRGGASAMDRKFSAVLFAVAVMSLVPAANAANLHILKGEVLLSHGDGYHTVQAPTEVKVGDTIVSRADSSAKITFADGCAVYLGMGMVFTVEPQSPCASDRSNQGETGAVPSRNSDETLVGGDGGWGAGTETLAASEETQTNVMPYLLGAAAIGGIAAAASTLGGGGDNGSPVSP